MPLYEYQCETCRRRFERIQKFSDPPIDTCPHCGGRVAKLLSSPAIQFKGSGWYITDYAKKSSGDASKPAEGSADKTDKSGKADTTPATGSSGSSSADASASKPTATPKD